MLTCIREKPWGSRLANEHKLNRCGQPGRSTVQNVSVCPFARRDPQPLPMIDICLESIQVIKLKFGFLFLCCLVFACSTGRIFGKMVLDIDEKSNCVEVELTIGNLSEYTLHLQDDMPLLSVIEDNGSSAIVRFSPGSYDFESTPFLELRKGESHTYHAQLAEYFELKKGAWYTVSAGGSDFTDPISHRIFLLPKVKRRFQYSGECKRKPWGSESLGGHVKRTQAQPLWPT